jgi:hypothetical protein
VTFLGMPVAPRGVGMLRESEPFPDAARRAHRCPSPFGWYVERLTPARITDRSSLNGPASTPSARACTSTFPHDAASVGPATTGRSHASATSWQNNGFATPPPTTWTVRTSRPVTRTASRTACRIATDMLSRMHRRICARDPNSTRLVRRQASTIRCVMPSGAMNRGS